MGKLEENDEEEDEEDDNDETSSEDESSSEEDKEEEVVPNATVLRDRSLQQHFPQINVEFDDICHFSEKIELPTVTILNQIVSIRVVNPSRRLELGSRGRFF